MNNIKVRKIVLTALFLALGMVLPFITGQIQSIGSMLLPMHIPVILCGFILGWQYGLIVGFILPVLRSAVFSMPPMYPTAVAMCFELAVYGFMAGFLYALSKKKSAISIYLCLIAAMLSGRIVWGIAMNFLTGGFTFKAFITAAFVKAVPGIILQLIVIPVCMVALKKANLIPIVKKN